ncbi:MAG: hypothetical protein MJE77_17270 [Proteobacteria bacterium]|nr:hypothetical protein [Pseudomonadota bacterium]
MILLGLAASVAFLLATSEGDFLAAPLGALVAAAGAVAGLWVIFCDLFADQPGALLRAVFCPGASVLGGRLANGLDPAPLSGPAARPGRSTGRILDRAHTRVGCRVEGLDRCLMTIHRCSMLDAHAAHFDRRR